MLTKFTLADLQACWGGFDAARKSKPKKIRGPRKFPLDLGADNSNLIGVLDFVEGPSYHRAAAREVTRLHAAFKARGERVRICKRRNQDSGAYNGRRFLRIVVVAA